MVLDALLDRGPFGRQAAALFDAVERTVLTGYVAAHAVTTVFYSNGVTGSEETTARMQAVVTALIRCVSPRSGEGSELELYGHASCRNYDQTSPYALWNRSSSNWVALAAGAESRGQNTATLCLPISQGIDFSWDIKEYDSDSPDDNLGSGSRLLWFRNISGEPSTTYSGTKTETVQIRNDDGDVDVVFSIQWTLID